MPPLSPACVRKAMDARGGNAYGFVLVLIAAVLIYVLVRTERMRRRERRYGGYGEAKRPVLEPSVRRFLTSCRPS